MRARPRLLDLFCGAGGAAMGYHRAGFEVVGVDNRPQPRYPFEFHQGDALEYLLLEGEQFDAIHASPPCQGYTSANRRFYAPHPKLIDETRRCLDIIGVPGIVENVVGARPEMPTAVQVCGGALGCGTYRHRLFESPLPIQGTPHNHIGGNVPIYGPLDGRRLWTRVDGTELRAARTLPQAHAAMGIDWMTWDELREAIPPAYTEYLGYQLLWFLQRSAEEAVA